MHKWAAIQNIVVLLSTAALVLGLFAMGAGGWSFWGLATLCLGLMPKGDG